MDTLVIDESGPLPDHASRVSPFCAVSLVSYQLWVVWRGAWRWVAGEIVGQWVRGEIDRTTVMHIEVDGATHEATAAATLDDLFQAVPPQALLRFEVAPTPDVPPFGGNP